MIFLYIYWHYKKKKTALSALKYCFLTSWLSARCWQHCFQMLSIKSIKYKSTRSSAENSCKMCQKKRQVTLRRRKLYMCVIRYVSNNLRPRVEFPFTWYPVHNYSLNKHLSDPCNFEKEYFPDHQLALLQWNHNVEESLF